MKGRTKPLIVYCALFSRRDSMIVAFYFLTRISIMTAKGSLKLIPSCDGFVAFDSLQSGKVTNNQMVILALQPFRMFYLTCFACVCKIFTTLSLRPPRRLYVQCVWFLGNYIFWVLLLNTAKKKEM